MLRTFKFLDVKTGDIYPIYLDNDARIVDHNIYAKNEKSKYFELYGRLDPELIKVLDTSTPDTLVDVAIWLVPPGQKVPEIPSNTISDAARLEILNAQSAIYAEREDPVIDFIKSRNYQVTYCSKYAPLIFATLSKNVIYELSNRNDIDKIYLAGICEPELDSAALTIKATNVWSNGYDGTGIKVAVVEGGGIAFANPCLKTGTYFNPSQPNIRQHTTEVAGIIGSIFDPYLGIAPGVPALMSANAASYGYDDLINATEWAITNGARVIDNSWGEPRPDDLRLKWSDKYFDHVVWEHRITVAKSAGNLGDVSGGENVTSPGLGYNVITVGAFDDKDTSSGQTM